MLGRFVTFLHKMYRMRVLLVVEIGFPRIVCLMLVEINMKSRVSFPCRAIYYTIENIITHTSAH